MTPTTQYFPVIDERLVNGYIRDKTQRISQQIPGDINDLIYKNMPNRVTINIDHLEKLWNFFLEKELRIISEEYSVGLSEEIYSPKCIWEQIADLEIWFESFNIPSIQVKKCWELAFYSNGRKTGMTLGCIN